MTNKEIREYPFLLIYSWIVRSCQHSCAGYLFFTAGRIKPLSWLRLLCNFKETWPQWFPLFYNGCGGISQRMNHCSCLYVCMLFRLVHLEGGESDRPVKPHKWPGCILHNRESLYPFPQGRDGYTIHSIRTYLKGVIYVFSPVQSQHQPH